jgi:small-conductance mechanosensitive channel/CRP-like cAMP-binding protein
MSFWQNVERASGMPMTFRWIIIGFLAAALLLSYFRPAERARIRSSIVLFALSLAGLLVAGAILSFGTPANSWIYLFVRGVSLFMEAVAIVNLVSVFVFAVALRSVHLEPPHIAQDLLLALVYIAAAIVVLSHSGVDLRGIVATSAVITAVVGFSLQDTLGNIMGGTVLQMERTIRAGDWIRLDDLEGRVKEIRWRQTSIETRNWDTVVIPNSVLMKNRVTLLGRRTGVPVQHRQWVYFQVDVTHSPTQVIEAVETALRAEPLPCVAVTPEIHCIVTEIKGGDVIYAVRYWLTDLAQPDPIDSLVRTRIYAALRRADLPLSVPMQSIFLTEEKSHREQVQTEALGQRLDALQSLELFQSLTEDERRELAARLVDAPFVRGEAMTRQGAQAHWLYIVVEGEAEVRVMVEGMSEKVATLRGGDYFGEMGLMTGEPRSSTVVAKSDVKCYRLGKDAFESILRRRPEMVEEISLTLARRRVELDVAREEASDDAMREQMRKTQGVLLRRIREFFGLGNEEKRS